MVDTLKKLEELESKRDKLLAEMVKLSNSTGIGFDADFGASNTYIPKGGKIPCRECDGNWQTDEDNPEVCEYCTEGMQETDDWGWQHSYC